MISKNKIIFVILYSPRNNKNFQEDNEKSYYTMIYYAKYGPTNQPMRDPSS